MDNKYCKLKFKSLKMYNFINNFSVYVPRKL